MSAMWISTKEIRQCTHILFASQRLQCSIKFITTPINPTNLDIWMHYSLGWRIMVYKNGHIPQRHHATGFTARRQRAQIS